MLNVIGHEANDMYDTFEWGDDPNNRYKIGTVLQKFRDRLVPDGNETFERYTFFKRN